MFLIKYSDKSQEISLMYAGIGDTSSLALKLDRLQYSVMSQWRLHIFPTKRGRCHKTPTDGHLQIRGKEESSRLHQHHEASERKSLFPFCISKLLPRLLYNQYPTLNVPTPLFPLCSVGTLDNLVLPEHKQPKQYIINITTCTYVGRGISFNFSWVQCQCSLEDSNLSRTSRCPFVGMLLHLSLGQLGDLQTLISRHTLAHSLLRIFLMPQFATYSSPGDHN